MSKNKYIKYDIDIVSPNAAHGMLGAIYAQMRDTLMAVPEPFTMHSSSPNVLAGVWAIFRETLITGHVERGLKEAIATTIAHINRCPWCVDAHSIALHATGYSKAVEIIEQDKLVTLNPNVRRLIDWAKATRTPTAPILGEPPFSKHDLPEIVGTAVTFHYLTRMVNALLVERILPKGGWQSTFLKRTLAILFRSHSHHIYPAGDSLKFLPNAELPEDLQWARTSPEISLAFAQCAAVIEQAGERVLPLVIRNLVHERIAAWNGEDMGLSRQWVREAAQTLPANHQPVAMLTLLAALAPHQITEKLVAEFRAVCPDDSALIETLAWGSFTAARRIGTWLTPQPV